MEGISGDEVIISLGDTNLPYLWSVEGVARLIKGIIGRQKGIEKIKISKSDYEIKVDNSVSLIRPYIASFTAKGKEIDGRDVFEQVLPKGSSLKIPSEITGSNSFGAEDGQMVKIIDKELAYLETFFGEDVQDEESPNLPEINRADLVTYEF